eukprot:CAMPEP_0206032876 /NCGR_PEP_ID=MMETSP1466-20131121/266_1 /ASSEMBLY_ACC=CAM_ASM_001126 /TAXON_ID=44452 /ORGANISM="Pavlova gyrans, Strain CCMP608" /LENGTH=48 /DNA_ID= /DNA_START= /DNA_END= /DNA_ORIENTATION=
MSSDSADVHEPLMDNAIKNTFAPKDYGDGAHSANTAENTQSEDEDASS